MLGAGSVLRRRQRGGVAPVVPYDPRLDVRLAAPGVVRASVSLRLMRYPIARPFCERFEALAREARADALVMDMGSLVMVTPAAGLYAIKWVKELSLRRIALVGGNPLICGSAAALLTLARFRDFRFFDSEETAVQWASAHRSGPALPC